MKKRKAISIGLLLTLMAPVAVLFSWHELKLYELRRELKWKLAESLDSSELILIKLSKEESKTQLEWEHDHEFEYRGEMYDVVRQEEHADTVFYYCWWDKEETRLNRDLEQLSLFVLQKDPEKNKNDQRIIQFYKSLFLHNQDKRSITRFYTEKANVFRPSTIIRSIFIETPHPPPKHNLIFS